MRKEVIPAARSRKRVSVRQRFKKLIRSLYGEYIPPNGGQWKKVYYLHNEHS